MYTLCEQIIQRFLTVLADVQWVADPAFHESAAGKRDIAGIVFHQQDGSDCHGRSEKHTSELQSLMRISYAVFCLKKKNNKIKYFRARAYTAITSPNTPARESSRKTKIY